MQGLRELLVGRTIIGIKRMGDLDNKPFLSACKSRFAKDEADERALIYCTKWQEELKRPDWHPYKIVSVDGKTLVQCNALLFISLITLGA